MALSGDTNVGFALMNSRRVKYELTIVKSDTISYLSPHSTEWE